MSKLVLVFIVSLVAFCTVPSDEQTVDDSNVTLTNWTYTYLKAHSSQQAQLRRFIEENWFVMDEKAVEQGLFKSYKLIENLSSSPTSAEPEWDFIVGVEYFGDQTYADIADGFERIRNDHDTVLVEEKNLRELGSVIRSERVRYHMTY